MSLELAKRLLVEPSRPKPMWSGTSAYVKAIESGDYYVEPKKDGVRCLCVCDGRSSYCFSRNFIPISFKIPSAIAGCCIPNSVIDGELIKLDGGKYQYIVFDIPVIRGALADITIEARRGLIEKCIPQIGPVRIIERLPCSTGAVVYSHQRGNEGVVLKLRGSKYKTGTTTNWFKVVS